MLVCLFWSAELNTASLDGKAPPALLALAIQDTATCLCLFQGAEVHAASLDGKAPLVLVGLAGNNIGNYELGLELQEFTTNCIVIATA